MATAVQVPVKSSCHVLCWHSNNARAAGCCIQARCCMAAQQQLCLCGLAPVAILALCNTSRHCCSAHHHPAGHCCKPGCLLTGEHVSGSHPHGRGAGLERDRPRLGLLSLLLGLFPDPDPSWLCLHQVRLCARVLSRSAPYRLSCLPASHSAWQPSLLTTAPDTDCLLCTCFGVLDPCTQH